MSLGYNGSISPADQVPEGGRQTQGGLEPSRSNSDASSGSNDSRTSVSSKTTLSSSRTETNGSSYLITPELEQIGQSNFFLSDPPSLPHMLQHPGYMSIYDPGSIYTEPDASVQPLEERKEPYVLLDSGYISSCDPGSIYMEPDAPVQSLEERKDSSYILCDTVNGRRFYCASQNCGNRTAFTRLWDLQRHQRNHSNGLQKWHCGCCKKMGNKSVYVTNRRDRMAQHMRKKHSSTDFETCSSESCGNDMEFVFSSKPCLMLHKRDEHELTDVEESELQRWLETATSAETLAHHCIRSRMPLIPSKRIKQSRNADAGSSRRQQEAIQEADQSSETTNDLTKYEEASSAIPPTLAGIGYWSESSGTALQTLPNFDLSQIPAPPALAPLGVGTMFANFEDWMLVCKEIENVRPLDFLIGIEAFNVIERELADSAISQNHILRRDIYISYNLFKNKMKVQGPKCSIDKAREDVEQRILSNRHHVATDDALMVPRAKVNAENVPCSDQEQATAARCRMIGNDATVFPLREKEDAELIFTWENSVLCCLSDILRPAIGNEYSACVVREGNTETVAKPCIQIESPELPDQANKKAVKRLIHNLLETKLRWPLPQMPKVYFYKGHMAYLVNKDDEEADEDEDEEDETLALEKRYWPKLGMSGSIGILGSKSVSATSGGYILVDDKRYLLLANHFIGKSLERMNRQEAQSENEILLTSPSLADVEDYRVRLEKSLSKYKDTTREILSRGEISLQDVKDFMEQNKSLDDLQELVKLLLLWIEVDRKEADFLVGRIAYWCSPPRHPLRFRQCVGPQAREDENNSIRMDWALGEVTTKKREGENAHRWRQSSDNSGELDYESNKAGNLCEKTCSWQPEAKVHYVGRTSGLRRGTVSSTRMLVSKDGQESNEWYIVPRKKADDEPYAGDSGAWVITDSGNCLMAQLWGHSRGMLLVTPIDEVFQDIQDFTGAKTIRLPGQDKRRPRQAFPCNEICEVNPEPQFRKKPKKIRTSALPTLKQLFKDAEALLQPLVIPTEKMIDGEGHAVRTAPFDASLELPPISPIPSSPVPSLVSSTSSLDRCTPSPAPPYGRRTPTTPMQPDSHPLLPHYTTSAEPLILDPDSRPALSQEPEPLEGAAAIIQTIQETTKTEVTAATKRQKHSIQFMLDGPLPTKKELGHAVKNLTDKPIAMPRPIKPMKKRSTFPMFGHNPGMPAPAVPAAPVAAN